ncbi:MAG: DUF3892 domain-containing protein [Defluviitaleaceae bacterium]|nr:DUF3892 domain-containing protein [Defluviitaleaceae bacterium]
MEQLNANTNLQGSVAALPKMAMEIPEARADAVEITALVKDEGRVSGYQLSSGLVLDKSEAVSLARQGGIKGVGISERSGNEYLKSIPDGTDSNNLGNLPSITQG